MLSYSSVEKSEAEALKKHRAAVVANGAECAEIGRGILKKGGSAADAAIATLFCEGVTCPQSMGLGGGFLLVSYDHSSKKAEFLNARETAPAQSTQNMFVERPEAAVTGGLSIAVPGELKGYWELYERHGHLPWAELVQPTIDLCRKGHIVTPYLTRVFARSQAKILDIPSLREIYIDPKTNLTYKEGERIKRLKLADSLEIIAREGANALYSKNGSLISNFVKDVQDFGGILTEDDMINYQVKWEEMEETLFSKNKYKLFASPLPGSGPLLAFIFRLMENFKVENSVVSWYHIIEAFKFAYAERTKLGDLDFVEASRQVIANMKDENYVKERVKKLVNSMTSSDFAYYGADFSQPEDHGTAHISVLAENGDAIAVTSTINYM